MNYESLLDGSVFSLINMERMSLREIAFASKEDCFAHFQHLQWPRFNMRWRTTESEAVIWPDRIGS